MSDKSNFDEIGERLKDQRINLDSAKLGEIVRVGIEVEQDRFVLLLQQLGVIRDSMVDIDWQVIYTEDGPKDISWAELLGLTK